MSKKAWAVVGAVVVLGLAIWQLGPWGKDTPQAPAPFAPATAGAVDPVAVAQTLEVDLYFPGVDGRLYVERREIPALEDLEARITALVEQLIAGPASTNLRAPLADVAVAKVFLMADGTVAIDLASTEEAPAISTGSLRERLTVYSLVNSVLRNIDEAKRVLLLRDGRQPPTFAGHLSTAMALEENLDLVAERR